MKDRSVQWALNRAAAPGGRPTWRNVPPFEYAGVAVTAAEPGMPFGRALARQARNVHVAEAVFSARRGLSVVGSAVLWACGGRSLQFELLAERGEPLCVRCALASGLMVMRVEDV